AQFVFCQTSFTFLFSGALLALHSFPTRRSSDLFACPSFTRRRASIMAGWIPEWLSEAKLLTGFSLEPCGGVGVFSASEPGNNDRSEEHTSELQSRFELVCRLVLVKNNNVYVT